MTADQQLLDRTKAEVSPAGEHLKRLRKIARSADRGEGIDVSDLPREDLRKALSAAPR